MEKEFCSETASCEYPKNIIIDTQSIKWASAGKEGVLCLTRPDQLSCPEDTECPHCSYNQLCSQIKIPEKAKN